MADDPRGARYNTRSNADAAYAAFMSMSPDEFRDCLFSRLRGGVFEPQENIGFERALADRPPREMDITIRALDADDLTKEIAFADGFDEATDPDAITWRRALHAEHDRRQAAS